MKTNTLTVKCELNVEDVIAWNNYYLENSAQWKKNWKLIRFLFMPVMAVCFFLGLYFLVIGMSRGLTINTLILAGIGLILGGGGFWYYLSYPDRLRRKIRKTAQKMYGQFKNNLVGPHKYSMSTEGVRDEVGSDDSTVKWQSVEDIVQTGTHIFILVHPKKAIIIPKRAFPDESAINRFTQELKAMFQAAQKTA